MRQYKDNSKMFIAFKELFRSKKVELFIVDLKGRFITNNEAKAQTLAKYYSSIFYLSNHHISL